MTSNTIATEKASQLTAEQLAELSQPHDGWCVSMYLPTHRSGKEIREDPIRLKNRLADAKAKLKELGAEEDGIEESLCSLNDLCDLSGEANQEFWRHQEDGLAVLVSSNGARFIKLSVGTPEETIVGHQYMIRPLLKAIRRDGEYGLVAVSREGVRFLEGSKRGLTETDLDDLPESLQAVVGGSDQKGFNLHSFQSAGKSNGEEAVPHGHVDKDEFEKLKRYFTEIASAVDEAQSDDPRPIVFAGVDELFPYFKQACEGTRIDLVEQAVTGNPDDAGPDDLHEKAWGFVSKRLHALTEETLDRYRSQQHTDRTCDDLEEIVCAANEGRVELLIVESKCRPLGSYDPTQRRVMLEEARRDQKIDLADLASAATLAAGGEVLVVEADRLDFPETGVVAVYRYTV